ncbi:hypothetical protein AZA_27288 [Nitrospirillum viridazoti Y2]|uniref:Uncharacterized protein n=1 Tax=Nitrospirillum amazonense TaxID=28077 RepID=A0A560HXY4_9PROT|nr:hypothetical protein [Nitrospirillum amazonense]EGY02018.1 hypothetical protein AZA_27288 [Nitrospirillum amazonense Y2]TWB51518.1 hypothetical protein FBZ92_120112 [Nitrospirillum amazonense]
MISAITKRSLKALLMPVWRRVSYRIEIRLAPTRERLHQLEQQLALVQAQQPSNGEHLANRIIALENRFNHIEHDLNHRLHVLSGALNELQAQWRVYVPSFVGAIAAVKRSGTEATSLAQRVDQLATGLQQHQEALQEREQVLQAHGQALRDLANATETVLQKVEHIGGAPALQPAIVPPPLPLPVVNVAPEPDRLDIALEDISALAARLESLEARLDQSVHALQTHVNAQPGVDVQGLNSTLSARIHSVGSQTDALSEQLLQIRRSLSEDVNDLWQFVRAHTARNEVALHRE